MDWKKTAKKGLNVAGKVTDKKGLIMTILGDKDKDNSEAIVVALMSISDEIEELTKEVSKLNKTLKKNK